MNNLSSTVFKHFILVYITVCVKFRKTCIIEKVVSESELATQSNGSAADSDSDSDVICLDDEPKTSQKPPEPRSNTENG
jgi:hypothetical protein